MKSTIGGQWRISGRSRGPRTALARMAMCLVLATASFLVAAPGVASLASAAGVSRHHSVAGVSRHHSVAGVSRQRSVAGGYRHPSVAGVSRHHSVAGVSRHHSVAGVSRHHSVAGVSRHHSVAGVSRHHSLAGVPRHHSVAGVSPSGKTPASQAITSAPSSATVRGARSPAITVVKSASPRTFSVAGERIHYRFDVTNSGNVTLRDIRVHDTGLRGLSAITCPHRTLAAGASQTCTATYLTTAADVDAGSVTNRATAKGDPPSGKPVVSALSEATITAIRSPAITVVKSASPSTFSVAGETIHYSFDVTNSGNVTLTSVKVHDTGNVVLTSVKVHDTGTVVLTSVKVHDTGLPGLSAISCPHRTLAAGASQTCTATYLTTAADVDAGSVTNHATAKGDPQTGRAA